MTADRRTARYRFYDAAGEPLYFGIAVDPEDRWLAHRSTIWWALVDHARTQIEWYADRSAAEAAETLAIRTHRPRFNRTDNPDHLRQTMRPVDLDVFVGHGVVGAAEIRAALRVSRQRVQQLVERPDLPRPRVRLAMGRLWSTVHVLAWLSESRPDVDIANWYGSHAGAVICEGCGL